MPYGQKPVGAGTRLMGGASPRPVTTPPQQSRPGISPIRVNPGAPQSSVTNRPQMPNQGMAQAPRPQLGVIPQPGMMPPNMGPPQIGQPTLPPPMGQMPPMPGMFPTGPGQMPMPPMGQPPMGQPGMMPQPMGQQSPMNPAIAQLIMRLLAGQNGGGSF